MRNNYVFTKDDHSITLYKRTIINDEKSKKYGQEVDKVIGHYTDINSVVKKLIHLELLSKGTLDELLTDFKAVNMNVRDYVKEQLGETQ